MIRLRPLRTGSLMKTDTADIHRARLPAPVPVRP